MKKLKNFKPLNKEEQTKIYGGAPQNAGDCSNFISMPEPGRYCQSDT
ncbi:hypothetical protein [uncultured Aquimarina sp.]|nr:hypothetical protein [uncultured Aquimarina sp.]